MSEINYINTDYIKGFEDALAGIISAINFYKVEKTDHLILIIEKTLKDLNNIQIRGKN